MRSLALAAVAGVSMAYDHWAVLIAGSNTYANYRHQADIHHAYQRLRDNGMPAENIILMSYDDVAGSRSNPYPGKLFNKPNGFNVYNEDDVSYRGDQVNKNSFMSVLKGDSAAAGGPVLESTSASKVFVYFADHGAPGFVCMPSGSYLYADEIQDTLQYMYDNNMYSELVWYMEACESGSMFPNLTADLNVYAVTAANATESSWGTYCGDDAVVYGENLNTCLGDLFSVNWMEDADAANAHVETLATQFDNVKAATTKSHVQKFGDEEFTDEAIGNFEGAFDPTAFMNVEEKSWSEHIIGKIDQFQALIDDQFYDHDVKKRNTHSVDSREINLHHLYRKYQETGDAEDLAALQAELSHRGRVDGHFEAIFGDINSDFNVDKVTDFDCLRFMVNRYEAACGKFSDYSLKYSKYLSWSCENLEHDQLSTIVTKIGDVCTA